MAGYCSGNLYCVEKRNSEGHFSAERDPSFQMSNQKKKGFDSRNEQTFGGESGDVWVNPTENNPIEEFKKMMRSQSRNNTPQKVKEEPVEELIEEEPIEKKQQNIFLGDLFSSSQKQQTPILEEEIQDDIFSEKTEYNGNEKVKDLFGFLNQEQNTEEENKKSKFENHFEDSSPEKNDNNGHFSLEDLEREMNKQSEVKMQPQLQQQPRQQMQYPQNQFNVPRNFNPQNFPPYFMPPQQRQQQQRYSQQQMPQFPPRNMQDQKQIQMNIRNMQMYQQRMFMHLQRMKMEQMKMQREKELEIYDAKEMIKNENVERENVERKNVQRQRNEEKNVESDNAMSLENLEKLLMDGGGNEEEKKEKVEKKSVKKKRKKKFKKIDIFKDYEEEQSRYRILQKKKPKIEDEKKIPPPEKKKKKIEKTPIFGLGESIIDKVPNYDPFGADSYEYDEDDENEQHQHKHRHHNKNYHNRHQHHNRHHNNRGFHHNDQSQRRQKKKTLYNTYMKKLQQDYCYSTISSSELSEQFQESKYMNKRTIGSVAKKQMRELIVSNPILEDFYFTTFISKKTGRQPFNYEQRCLDALIKQQREEDIPYFENRLFGRIPSQSIHTPRKLLNIDPIMKFEEKEMNEDISLELGIENGLSILIVLKEFDIAKKEILKKKKSVENYLYLKQFEELSNAVLNHIGKVENGKLEKVLKKEKGRIFVKKALYNLPEKYANILIERLEKIFKIEDYKNNDDLKEIRGMVQNALRQKLIREME